MHGGWSQVAFLRDLGPGVSPLELDGRALMAVRDDRGVRVFDARCPHRGAHLGYGGTVDGDSVVCPFHGNRVHLGSPAAQQFCVREYPTLCSIAGVFVRLTEEHENGLGAYLAGLEVTHHVVPSLTLDIAVPPEYVVENVFDADHFAVVHGLERRPRISVRPDPGGALNVESVFETQRPNQWQGDRPDGEPVRTPFLARVFSPTLVVTELGDDGDAAAVVTAATPVPAGTTRVRVTVALPRQRAGGPATVREVASLVDGSRTAFAQDSVVWEHLDPDVVPQWTGADGPVRQFREFCERFPPVPS